MRRFIKSLVAVPKSYLASTWNFSELEVETTSLCNRKCSYCPNVTYDKSGPDGNVFMEDSLIQTLFSQLKEIGFKGTFSPHMYGEPLLDLRIVDIIKNASLLGMSPKLVTNGDYLNEDILAKLIDSGLERLYISKHSSQLSSKAKYALAAHRESLIQLKEYKILDFYSDFKQDQSMLGNRGGMIKLTQKKKPPIMCPYVRYPVIDVVGNVVLCCQDYSSRHIMGNIKERSISDIWNDPSNMALRRRIYRGKFTLNICKSCEME